MTTGFKSSGGMLRREQQRNRTETARGPHRNRTGTARCEGIQEGWLREVGQSWFVLRTDRTSPPKASPFTALLFNSELWKLTESELERIQLKLIVFCAWLGKCGKTRTAFNVSK